MQLSEDNSQLQLAQKFESVKITSRKAPQDCPGKNDNEILASCQLGKI